jgi:hypothetical protein
MATAGVFRLMVNDGKADKMIMATDMLDCRIKEITALRMAEGYAHGEELPTLLDIEQTHILFVNAHFRPFAAVAYEYTKVKVQSGTPQWGGSVTFSIPQQGDFFHDMVLHVTLSAATATNPAAFTAPADRALVQVDADNQPFGTGAVDLTATANIAYDVVDLTLSNVVAVGGAPVPAGYGGALHYCNLPGARLIKNTYFTVNGNPLDNYPSDSYVFYDKYRVSANKRTGWNRCMGQEVPLNGWSRLNVAASSAATVQESSRRRVQVLRGAQTPKITQPALEMWIPLLFWFSQDPRLSIASVSIPHGQRYITVDIQEQAKILYLTPSLKLRSTVTVTRWAAIPGAGATTPGALWGATPPAVTAAAIASAATVTTFHDLGATSAADTTTLPGVTLPASSLLGSLPTQTFSTFDLYINNIYLNPNVHDIYIERIGFSLIRIHRNQTVNLCVNESEVLLSAFKFPIEYFFVGLRPATNLSDVTKNDTDWNQFTWQTSQSVTSSSNSSYPLTTDSFAVDANHFSTNVHTQTGTQSFMTDQFTYRWPTRTIDTLAVTAHGISMYNAYNAAFFQNYVPMQYGGDNIVTAEDEGVLMVNFCLYPGTYQPSGHINVSRSREFHVTYTSSVVGGSVVTSADLVAEGSAINFLLISDGSAVLRYST